MTLANARGCCSIAILNRKVKSATSSITRTSVCPSRLPYSWNGSYYNAAGTDNVTLVNAAGCDSIATLNLTLNAATTSTTNVSVCSCRPPYT